MCGFVALLARDGHQPDSALLVRMNVSPSNIRCPRHKTSHRFSQPFPLVLGTSCAFVDSTLAPSEDHDDDER